MITGLGESNSEKLAGAPGFEPGVADPKGVDPSSRKVAAVHSVFGFQLHRPPEDAEIHGSPSGLPSRLPSGERSLSTDVVSRPPSGTGPEALALRERELLREERVDGAHSLTLQVRTDMRVDVERDGHTRVAQHLRHHLWMDTLLQQPRRCRMAKVMESDLAGAPLSAITDGTDRGATCRRRVDRPPRWRIRGRDLSMPPRLEAAPRPVWRDAGEGPPRQLQAAPLDAWTGPSWDR